MLIKNTFSIEHLQATASDHPENIQTLDHLSKQKKYFNFKRKILNKRSNKLIKSDFLKIEK